MYTVSVLYDDGNEFTFKNINKIGCVVVGSYKEYSGEEILNCRLPLSSDYVFFSDTSVSTISREHLRYIKVFKN